ncbi:hypothetical protein H5410_062520 [Solanum commersonii]|uniref:Uncharacterized protein n=1 Tax=Solanum commersonii TaxID=4109 RepID=A0A9J5WB19_SOLCO|nr:hypothetical protein H5410_062520 [Solanum commersonii]
MLNSDSRKSYSNYSSQEESSTSEDLKALHQEDYMSSEEDCLPCQQGLECDKPFSHILVQHGNKQLIAANSSSSTSGTSGIDINHLMYKEFMDFMKSKKESDNDPPTYSTILMDEENIEVFDLNDKREVIL